MHLNAKGCQGRSHPTFPFKPRKAFSQNFRGERPLLSLRPKAASFLGVGRGGGERSGGMPPQKLFAIFGAFFVHCKRSSSAANKCWPTCIGQQLVWATVGVCERHNNKLGKTWRE